MSTSPDAAIPPDFTAPFDTELGLRFTELSPDGARAQLEVTPKLLQPMGLVHGGVYCSMVESMASVSAYTWLATRGGGNVVGVNNNTDFLRSIGSGTAGPNRFTADGVSSCGWSASPTRPIG